MKISVVIATYNGEKYIKEQIHSIIHQTRKIDELIICDDNSSDNTISIIEKCLNDLSITTKIYKHSKNQGVLNTFREGISLATGDIIFLSDQDDVWLENKVQLFCDAFDSYKDVFLVFSNAHLVDDKLNFMKKTMWNTLHFKIKNGICNNKKIFKELMKRNIFAGMYMAFRREIVDQNFWFSNNMLHDECIGWNAMYKGSIYAISEPTILYRQHDNNVIGAVSKKRKKEEKYNICQQILKSNEKTKNKFCDCKKVVTPNQLKTLNKALRFYSFRNENVHKNFFVANFFLLKNFISCNYRKYSSKTEHLFLKDVYLILFFKFSSKKRK